MAETYDVPAAEYDHKLDMIKAKEMQADDWGFFYAAMAGFQVDKLVRNIGEDDFFTFWMQQTNTKVHRTHPKPEDRSRLLQIRLKELSRQIDFFKFGVRLALFGQFEDAIFFLEKFQRIFPAREVLNNLGFCYLQLARQRMGRQAYHFWLPLMIDLDTQASNIKLKGDSIPPEARRYLQVAIDHLQRAVEADKQYLPSHVNLAIAYFLLEEPFQARAIIEKTIKLAPDNMEIAGLRALIIAQESNDSWKRGEAILADLNKQKNSPLQLRYNLAQLREEHSQAKSDWQALVADADNMPAPYRKVLAGNITSPLPTRKMATDKGQPVPPFLQQSNIKPGMDMSEEGKAAKLFAGWQETLFTFGTYDLSGAIYKKGPSSILVMDDIVDLVVYEQNGDKSVKDHLVKYGPPKIKQSINNMEIWFYPGNWALLVNNETIKEVWIARENNL